MLELGRGALSKMSTRLEQPVQYSLRLGEQDLDLNALLGQGVRLEYLGAIHCSHCGRKTKKSFSQGYCYPCFSKLAQCDTCIMSPERCHYAAGTCREPAWGEQFCMTEHVVYLANSSGAKVGITRATQVPTRWIDQGATQALPIMRVATRQQSGLVEDVLRSQVTDRTNWRAMLKGEAAPLDLAQLAGRSSRPAMLGSPPCKSALACRRFSPSAILRWWTLPTRCWLIPPKWPVLIWKKRPSSRARCRGSRAST